MGIEPLPRYMFGSSLLMIGQTVRPETLRRFWNQHNIQKASPIRHIFSFVQRSSLNINSYSGSKCWLTFRLDDVINDVIITYSIGHSFTSMVHPHIKLTDHTSESFIVTVKNVVISFKHECRRLGLTLRCDVTDDVTSVKHTFSWDNLQWSFRIWCQNEPV